MKTVSLVPYLNSIKEFMDTFNQPCYPSPETTPPEVAKLRGDLIDEETTEYGSAQLASTDELDALCDLLYVVGGAMLTMSIPPVLIPILETKKSRPIKRDLFTTVIPAVQDLHSRFPCFRIQSRELNAISKEIFNIAAYVGYNFEGAFKTVHASNMSKLWTADMTIPAEHFKFVKPNGILVKNAKGKVIKPTTFRPPELTPYLPHE